VSALRVGRVSGAVGTRGELKFALSRVGEDALAVGTRLQLAQNGAVATHTVSSLRSAAHGLVVKLEEVDDRNAAERMIGAEVSMERAAIELAPGEYLDADLIGLRMLDRSGHELGTVAGVEHYPAQDCLVLEGSGKLVPLVAAFVQKIDLEGRTIVVDLPEGLLED
jgi:16S rRNA processing protein RimM